MSDFEETIFDAVVGGVTRDDIETAVEQEDMERLAAYKLLGLIEVAD